MILIAGATIVFALSIPGCSQQQENPAIGEAIALAEKGSDALIKLEWANYAALVHPEELSNLKANLLPTLETLSTQTGADSIALFDRKFAVEELRGFSGEQFFVNIIGTIFKISPELQGSFTNMTEDHLGAVVESDTLIHVVVHTGMMLGMRHVDEMNITTVRSYEGGWRLKMSAKINGVVMMLQQSLQMQQMQQGQQP